MLVFMGHRSDGSWFMGKAEGLTILLLTSPRPQHWERQVWLVAWWYTFCWLLPIRPPLGKGGFGELKAAFVTQNTERGKWVRCGYKTKIDMVTTEVSQHRGWMTLQRSQDCILSSWEVLGHLNGFSASWHSCSTPRPSVTPYRPQSPLLVAYHGAWVGSSTTG